MMAIREIKATLALDGEKKFKAELDEASRSIRIAETGLKAIEASYVDAGKNSEYLAKKSEVLKDELEQQKHIVATLGNALREAETKYGNTAKQTDGYRIKLNNAIKKQAEMEKAIRETERELDELGKESISVGREIEQGVGDAAEDAGKSLKGMYENLQGDIDVLKGSAVASAVADVGGFVVDAVSGVMDFVESNRDYRGQQAFTEQQIRDAGLELQSTMGLIYEAASFTGDLDGAREALSNLMGVGFSLEELQSVLANLTGMHIRNPESFRIETMAESLRETVQQAEATGVFADYLMSLSDILGKPAEQIIEEFNMAMDVAENLDERQAVAMHYLGQSGGVDTKLDFAEREKELIEARAAQMELTNAWAELAEEIEPIVTGLTKAAATVVNGLADTVEMLKTAPKWAEGIEAGTQTQEEAVGVLVSGEAEEEAKKIAHEVGNESAEAFKNGYIEGMAENPFMYYENEALNVDWTKYFEKEKEAGKDVAEAQTAAQEEAKTAGTEIADAFFEGYVESMDQYAAMYNQHEALGMDYAAYFANESEMQQAGEDDVNAVKEGMEEAEPALTSTAETMGKNTAIAAGNGINAEAPFAISAAAALADGINAELSRIGMGNNLTAGLYDRVSTGTGSKSASASGSSAGSVVTVPLYMDSQKVGEAVIPSVSAGIGMQIKQAVTIG